MRPRTSPVGMLYDHRKLFSCQSVSSAISSMSRSWAGTHGNDRAAVLECRACQVVHVGRRRKRVAHAGQPSVAASKRSQMVHAMAGMGVT
jgi:hypothetical protein